MSEIMFEEQLHSIAKRMEYPLTPDIAGSVMTRLRVATRPRLTLRARSLAWSLTIIVILFSSLMLIPPARAAIIEFFQIGVVRIFRAEPTPLPALTEEIPSTMIPVTATPAPTSLPLIPLLERLAGETTLAEAQQRANYPILLPTYPPDLGKPDRVFVQDADGDMTILVWIDPREPSRVRLSLHFIPTGSWAINKMGPTVIEETHVNDKNAVWAVGPYPLKMRNGNLDVTRLIEGHVLIWADGDVTYRLETDLSLDEAIKIAESLQPIH